MLNVKVSDGTTLVVDSDWDSGVHCNFNACVVEEGSYCGKPLNEVLTKSQITSLEYLLATYISKQLEENLVKGEHK